MKTRIRIFLAMLVTVGIGLALLINWISNDLKPEFRRSTEEPLVDTAWMLAALASTQMHDGIINVGAFRTVFDNLSHRITPSPIYGFVKKTTDIRVYITDKTGKVLFDSSGRDEGADYSRWNDVLLTIQGKYGTRTSSDPQMDPELSVMYVAAPIKEGDKIVGVVSVGKPTRNVNAFVKNSQKKVSQGGLLTFLAVVIATLVVSAMVTRPIERLTTYARAVGRGARPPLPQLGSGEVGQLGQAFEEMRVALEGKQYVENYVQSLTHEMKSPLAAISGAAELLKEEMPQEVRERFLTNIENESDRLRHLIERLLLLASIENRKQLQDPQAVNLSALLSKAAAAMLPTCKSRGVEIKIDGEPSAIIEGESFLLEQTLSNILQNAVEFSPQGGIILATINIIGDTTQLTVDDQGPGIPEYGLSRIYERFYSLGRPDTGKKSSGLGLSLVKETMSLHNGEVELANLPYGGVRATLCFPLFN